MPDNPLTLFRHEISYYSFKLPCYMNQRENLIVETPLTLSTRENTSIIVTDEKIFEIGKSKNESLPVEHAVNNYLKTPEEMEADFCFVINSRRAFHEKENSFDTYGRPIKRTDGYMNIQGLDEILSGSMEENY